MPECSLSISLSRFSGELVKRPEGYQLKISFVMNDTEPCSTVINEGDYRPADEESAGGPWTPWQLQQACNQLNSFQKS